MNRDRLAKMSLVLLLPLAGLLVWGVVQHAAETPDEPEETETEAPRGSAVPDEWRDGPEGEAAPPEPGVNVGDEIPPWEAEPENTPPARPGTVPAYELAEPPTETADPPAPTPPPDPLTTEPPRHNPGGVEGERGPRHPEG